MNIDFSNKNALVCGSTQGIGLAAATELASLGANVTLLARNPDKLKAAAEVLQATSKGRIDFFGADFAKPGTLKTALEGYFQAQKEISGTPKTFHILVNNTGGPPAGPAHRADIEDFRNAFNQHLICNQILVQAVLEGMKNAAYGRIINVISTSVKQPLHDLGVSNTVRGAVASWAKTLANELGPWGITVNNVLPGPTETERLTTIIQRKAQSGSLDKAAVEKNMLAEVPAGRFARPEEIAAAIAFLASPAAAYINGVNLPVDGGRTGCL